MGPSTGFGFRVSGVKTFHRQDAKTQRMTWQLGCPSQSQVSEHFTAKQQSRQDAETPRMILHGTAERFCPMYVALALIDFLTYVEPLKLTAKLSSASLRFGVLAVKCFE